MLRGRVGGRGRRKGNAEAARVQMAPANAFIELPRNAIKEQAEKERERAKKLE